MRHLWWNIKYFFSKIYLFFKYDFGELLLEYGLHVLSVVFAAVGIVTALESETWLMIVGAVVAISARFLGFIVQESVGSTSSLYDPPELLASNLVLMILSAVGMFLVRFLLKINYGTSFLISLNGCVLLFYALYLCYILVRFVKYRLYRWKMYREYRQEQKRKKNSADDDDEF